MKRVLGIIIPAVLVVGGTFGPALGQEVDRWQFRELRDRVDALSEEMQRSRSAAAGGGVQQRLNSLEDEISRLTGQIERLEHAVRTHEAAAQRKLEDLEYRIIELEGGDPSVMFQKDPAPAPNYTQPAPSSSVASSSSASPSGGGTLGVLTTPAPAGSASAPGAFASGVDAAKAGRYGDAIAKLGDFITANPQSPLMGEASYWLGRSYYGRGNYQIAASLFLDAASNFPSAPTAPDNMMQLGLALDKLGQRDVACSTFKEVSVQFPNASAVRSQAASEARRVGCP